jgi:hypothetical protein
MAFPDRPLTEHLGISPERLNWMRANERIIWQAIEPVLDLGGRDAIQQYLYGIPYPLDNAPAGDLRTTTRGISSRSGLYIGFRMAEEFLNSFRRRDMKALLDADWEDVLSIYKAGSALTH